MVLFLHTCVTKDLTKRSESEIPVDTEKEGSVFFSLPVSLRWGMSPAMESRVEPNSQ